MLRDYIKNDWKELLKDEFTQEYFLQLEEFLKDEFKNETIYPQEDHIFEALNRTSFADVKVVILGQDPYHGKGQAHGLCFSVQKDIKIPPSLRNIYKELNDDIAFSIPEHGHLIEWANQGVLLLNNVLTVRESSAGSHQKKGWEKFTDKVIEIINQEKEQVVFLLWGSPAQKKARAVDTTKHHVLKSVHPSPLSSYRGFFGSGHFSKCNHYLKEHGLKEIDWQIT